jgi:hypothetical protein
LSTESLRPELKITREAELVALRGWRYGIVGVIARDSILNFGFFLETAFEK